MKIIVSLIAFMMLVLPVASIAHGQSETVTPEERRQAALEFKNQLIEDRKQELTEARAARIVNRCEAVQTRITQHTGRLLALRAEKGGLISNLVTRLESFSQRLQAANLDTTELDEDIATLKTMSGELDALWATYAEKLDAVKKASCDDGADALHGALEAAKAAAADVRAKFKEAKDFLRSDIKDDLTHLRADLAGGNEANGDSAE